MPVPENGEGTVKVGVCGRLAREVSGVVHS